MIHASHARRSDSEPDIAARFSAAGDLSRGWQGQEAHAGQHHALACGQDRSVAAAAAEEVLGGDQAAGLKLLRSLPHGHVAAALGVLRKVGLDGVLSQGGRQPAREVAVCVAMMVARVVDPSSKLATARLLDDETAGCSLGAVLGLGAVDEQALYDRARLAARTAGAHRESAGAPPSE